jgi:hypothetical protein
MLNLVICSLTADKEAKMRKLRDFFLWTLPLFLIALFTVIASGMERYSSSAANESAAKPICPDTMSPCYRPHK